MPCNFTGAIARFVDLGDEVVVVAHQATGFVAECGDTCTRLAWLGQWLLWARSVRCMRWRR